MGRSVAFGGLIVLTIALAACSQNSPQAVAPQSQAAAGRPEFVPGEVLVQYRANVIPADARALERALGLQRAETVAVSARGRLELVRVGSGAGVEAAIARLRAEKDVEFAEPNWIYQHMGKPGPSPAPNATATDPYFADGSLWGMYGPTTTPAGEFGSNAAAAWAAGQTGSPQAGSPSVYVGVIDEGIQYSHPDLSGQVGNPLEIQDGKDNDGNGFVDDLYGWDFANNDKTVYDGGTRGSLDKHGTHVSGTIGAKANNKQGVVGVSWNVRLISGKFLGRRGGTTANAIKAVDYFTRLKQNGLNVVATNNSWGGGGFSQALLDAIDRGGKAGILFVAAAGNGGSDGVGDDNDATPNYPSNYKCVANGTYDCVIAVAAITKTGGLASYSNYGATTVDIGAPGSAIVSTLPYNTYGTYSGTSMATPHVTGAIALYAAAKPGASAAAIRAAILAGAAPTLSLSGKTVSNGRLDANAALSK